MMLNKDKHGRERILSRLSVEAMTTDQLTPEQKAASDSFPGFWGQPRLGVRRVHGHPARRPVGGARKVRLRRRLRHVLVFRPQRGHGRDPDDPARAIPHVLSRLSRFLDLGLPGDRRLMRVGINLGAATTVDLAHRPHLRRRPRACSTSLATTPPMLARALTTLDHVSNGPLRVGLGVAPWL